MRRRWGWLTAATLVVLLAVTGVIAATVHNTVDKQEERLLTERANEVALVLSQAVNSLGSQLQTVGRVLQVTNASPAAFRRASAALTRDSEGDNSIALLRRTTRGYHVELASGGAYRAGQTIGGTLAQTLNRAVVGGEMVPTPVMGAGENRTIGFAYGPPVAPQGTVLYLQVTLGPLGPPDAASTDPFHELEIALFGGPTTDPSQALVATSTDIPLRGELQTVTVSAGGASWALQVKAVNPLVGSTTANAAWLTVAGGLLLSLLVAAVVEIETRRRQSAIALYRTEHQIAESLQRSLLPTLPTIDGLDVAARYVPGSAEQEVGGDWYDVFELDGGQVGIAVGDALGHDIEAAVLMSRVQTALRAHAIAGEPPAAVLDRLDRLVETLDTDRLVTVFFGILSAPGEAGERQFVFANAGHPPPLLHTAGGGVVELDDATSLLLGAPVIRPETRPQHALPVSAGSTLLLYTDGLVEVPGESLTDLIGDLKLAAGAAAGRGSVDDLCDQLLETMRPAAHGDDVAMLAIRLTTAARHLVAN